MYVCLLCRKLCSYRDIVIVRVRRAIWLNPFATVIFSVCSADTVECCVLYPCCMCVFGMFADMLLCREEGSSPVSPITEGKDMGLYEVPLFVSLLGFVMGTMLANFQL